MLDKYFFHSAYLEFLVTRGVISPEVSVRIVEEQEQRRLMMGQVALKMRFLSMKQVSRILNEQIESGLRFGEQAVELGFITTDQVDEILEQQERSTPGVGRLLTEFGHIPETEREFYRAEFLASLSALIA